MPKLFKAADLETERGWRWLMEDFGHVWFAIDGIYYFLFPLDAHRYCPCRISPSTVCGEVF